MLGYSWYKVMSFCQVDIYMKIYDNNRLKVDMSRWTRRHYLLWSSGVITDLYKEIWVMILIWTIHKYNNNSLQARIEKKLDEELPKEPMGGMKLGPKVSGNQGLSKS